MGMLQKEPQSLLKEILGNDLFDKETAEEATSDFIEKTVQSCLYELRNSSTKLDEYKRERRELSIFYHSNLLIGAVHSRIGET